jgi:DNA topoisomerase-1
MRNLVLVESPTKARNLARFLGPNYRVEATMGHIRDLPRGKFGIDIYHDFSPQYVIPREKLKRVNELKKISQNFSKFYLASDPDREGEAIAWHIKELLANSRQQSAADSRKPRAVSKFLRVVFHEITPQAIKEAFGEPGEINLKLVDAQQARRILDRIVGYKLSPLLWVKVRRGLSAGRVQSVALRLIVEREREIEKFKPREYWTVEALLRKGPETRDKRQEFVALLVEWDGKKIAIRNKEEADGILKELDGKGYTVFDLKQKEVKKYPQSPFTTSALQQQASARLYFSAKKTMALAQDLYEEGLITYHRTDSVNLANSAIFSARDFIKAHYGSEFLPPAPKKYRSISRVAQEAHEAIRPTDIKLTADRLPLTEKDHKRLYDLIWRRFVACQMREAVLDQKTVDIEAASFQRPETRFLFRAIGTTVKFPGWMKVYEGERGKVKGVEEPSFAEATEGKGEKILPELEIGEKLNLLQLIPGQHFTEPPPRYTEGSLVKALEYHAIGRPSTYAPIISTICERGYVEKIERAFCPTELGFAVNDYLVSNFPDIVDITFTAQMEEELDEIARGETEWVPAVRNFYEPFDKHFLKVAEESERVELPQEVTGEKCEKCGKDMVVRFGRFGKFLACSGFPECKNTRPLVLKTGLACPNCGGDIIQRKTKKGKVFWGCSNYPACNFASWRKPS